MGCDHPFHSVNRYGYYVSIHAPAWGATYVPVAPFTVPRSFNPRTRVGCDLYSSPAPSHRCGFNPRTRVGCDLFVRPTATPDFRFQSTHPRGVRRFFASASVWDAMFQSTHPRGVRRARLPAGRRRVRVSIHAPAWGATACWAPTALSRWSFNPRTRVGCDMRQATSDKEDTMFQSTHPRGVRHHQLSKRDAQLFLFQSTHPRGVRLCVALLSSIIRRCFNPRTRVGCDCFHVLSSRFP